MRKTLYEEQNAYSIMCDAVSKSSLTVYLFISVAIFGYMRADVILGDEIYARKYVVLIWFYQFSMRVRLFAKLSFTSFNEIEFRLRFPRARGIRCLFIKLSFRALSCLVNLVFRYLPMKTVGTEKVLKRNINET